MLSLCYNDRMPALLRKKSRISPVRAKRTSIRFSIKQSSLGPTLIAATDAGVCSILFGDDADRLAQELQRRFPRSALIEGDDQFNQIVSMVIDFIERPSSTQTFPVDVRGTVFQKSVWEALSRIPFGKTVSYSDIAKQIGHPKAVRAVAQACGANNIAVAIPCHRVVRTDGALAGYRWGVARKAVLLERERRG